MSFALPDDDSNNIDMLIDDENNGDVAMANVSGALPKSKTTKRKNPSKLEPEETILLKKALTALDNPEKKDEWDVFGQFVADDLRQISNLNFRNAAKREIMKVLLKYGVLDAPVIFVDEINSESKETSSTVL